MNKVATLLVSVFSTLILVTASQAQAGQATSSRSAVAPSTVALVVAWPDGRTNADLTSTRRAVMWTPLFSRIDGYVPAADTPSVYAVQFARAVVDGGIRVDVSVLLGTPTPPGVPVATVLVTRGSRITVEELRTFGVQPVTLSMVDVAPLTPYPPTVVSSSSSIVVDTVELLSAPYPGYRLTLRNVSLKSVSTVHVQSYRGQNRALSSLQRSDDGRPMIRPGGTYAFDMNLTSGPVRADVDLRWWTPSPLDLIELDAVRWDDGTYDGAPPYPQLDTVVEADSGRRLQLRRIVSALKQCLADHASDGNLLSSVKNALSKLPDSEPDQLDKARIAMQSIKAAVIDDLVRFESGMVTGATPTPWVTDLIRRYEGWLTRLSPP